MVFCVARAVECAQCCAFGFEGLSVADVVPAGLRVAFVDLGIGGVREEGRDAIDVVVMPVG
jgi:hypothetical protein